MCVIDAWRAQVLKILGCEEVQMVWVDGNKKYMHIFYLFRSARF